jgi:menaquinone-dependent protoporphyrinogen oxidase
MLERARTSVSDTCELKGHSPLSTKTDVDDSWGEHERRFLMRVLVAHASKQGGTAGLAEWIGETLEHSGLSVDVLPTEDVDEVGSYDAVIVGGALYMWRWHAGARRFVRRHAEALRHRPVWLFSSGPLDDSASEKEIPPVRSAAKAMELVGANGHATFGGRLLPGNKSSLPVGDWRDRARVDRWAEQIVDELTREPAADQQTTK